MNTYFNNNSNFIFLFVLYLIWLSFHSHSIVYSAKEGYETDYLYNETTGRGPSRWAQLDPQWYLCGNGTMQSPVEISDTILQFKSDLGALQRDYKPANATLYDRGHDIEVAWNGDAGNITINGTQYKLIQCHWHTPSEHTFNGLRYAMELHLVHKNSEGEIAVVGIVYTYSGSDPFLSKLYTQISSLRNGTTGIDLGSINPEDTNAYGMKNTYYRYNGSLTTPPCSEGVIWTLIKEVQIVSYEQVQALKDAVADGFEENARPIQSLNGRSLYYVQTTI